MVKSCQILRRQAKLHCEATSLPQETSLAAGKLSWNQSFVKQTIDSTVVPLGRESTNVIDILEFV